VPHLRWTPRWPIWCAVNSYSAAARFPIRPTASSALVRDAAYNSLLYPHLVRAWPVLEGRE
jgi:hypothetical protein